MFDQSIVTIFRRLNDFEGSIFRVLDLYIHVTVKKEYVIYSKGKLLFPRAEIS